MLMPRSWRSCSLAKAVWGSEPESSIARDRVVSPSALIASTASGKRRLAALAVGSKRPGQGEDGTDLFFKGLAFADASRAGGGQDG